MQPLVSVIIPTFNYGHFVRHTVECLQQQTYENWECIIVDDGSTDDTREVITHLTRIDRRIHYVWQENAKQGAARNNGISHARGNYFQFLDSDDLIETKKLEEQITYLEQHPEVDLTYSGVRYFTGDKVGERLLSRQYSSWETGGAWMPEISGQGKAIVLSLIKNNIMVVNAPLIRRKVIDVVGLFDADLTPVEDWEYWIRCAAKGLVFQFQDLEGSRALVRAHEMSSSLNQRRFLRAVLKMRQKVGAMELDRAALDLNRLRIAEEEGHLGVEEFVDGSYGTGIRQMLKAALADPRLRFKAKWLICAVSAPFVSKEQLKQMVTSSLTASVGIGAARSDD